ncbi:MAG TPA: gamma-glutamyl-gamma-aminobutyrate hydrolase family protein [Chloroflexota bacterium]|nr:gamma-glutamyl-gamma-aminobutyrate hydrolase family protein [Chloroflexota bacterium]HZU05852.1 gamma-glutamyl-gamma-aminobutyrate hydrolase family protein [Chloroflexota bacterium]
MHADRAVRPLIGISCAPQAPHGRRPAGFRQNRSYARAIVAAGGLPVLVPLLDDEAALRALYERLDGLLLPGGGDVNPACYGEAPRPDSGIDGVDDLLDHVELTLARWALAEGKPLLGICRGQQALNVAAGGTLYQDIQTQLAGALCHQHPEARTALVHPITVAPDSRLAAVLGATELRVNSIHHQAVKALAPGFRAVAYAPDGVLEGIEHEHHPFALAVQFHPEELVPHHSPSARLFAAFVAACRR